MFLLGIVGVSSARRREVDIGGVGKSLRVPRVREPLVLFFGGAIPVKAY